MTREDMLRELELLPVWRLRKPLPEIAISHKTAVNESFVAIAEVDTVEKQLTPAMPQQDLTYIFSNCDQWLFILSKPIQNNDEAQLLSNIFKAMRIQVKPGVTKLYSNGSLDNTELSMLITMGELATQMVLQTSEPLVNLRGRLYDVNKVKLVPTYEVEYLLTNAQDKAIAWHDLCIAMQALQKTSKKS